MAPRTCHMMRSSALQVTRARVCEERKCRVNTARQYARAESRKTVPSHAFVANMSRAEPSAQVKSVSTHEWRILTSSYEERHAPGAVHCIHKTEESDVCLSVAYFSQKHSQIVVAPDRITMIDQLATVSSGSKSQLKADNFVLLPDNSMVSSKQSKTCIAISSIDKIPLSYTLEMLQSN